MKKLLAVALTLLLLGGALQVIGEEVPEVEKPHAILILGDSIAAGYMDYNPGQWGDDVNHRYSALIENDTGIPVTNRAVSGWTTRSLLDGLEEKTRDVADVDLIGISIGGNDVMWSLSSNGIPKAMENLGKIFDKLLEKYPDATIVIQTIYNPLDNGTSTVTLPFIDGINAAIKELAGEYEQVTVLDVFAGFAGKADEYIASDHVHPHVEGHKKIAAMYEELWSAIRGDVDRDRSVTASDALLALQAATGKVELSALRREAADIDGSDDVEAADALAILQASTGKIEL